MSKNHEAKEFLEQKILAVVGASSDPEKYGNIVYKKLKDSGYIVYPVNPNNIVIEGDTCYTSLKNLPEKADGVVVIVPPQVTEKIVRELHELGIKRIWMQPGAQSEEAEDYCKNSGICCISSKCILVALR